MNDETDKMRQVKSNVDSNYVTSDWRTPGFAREARAGADILTHPTKALVVDSTDLYLLIHPEEFPSNEMVNLNILESINVEKTAD